MSLVCADGVISRPLAVVETLAQRQRSFVKWSTDRHRSVLLSGRAIISMLATREQEKLLHESPRKKLMEGILMNVLIKRFAFIGVVAALLSLGVANTQAQTNNAKKLADATRHAQQAADAFTEIMNVAD